MKTKISLVLALVTISAAPAWAGSKHHQEDSSRKAFLGPKILASKIWLPQNQPQRFKSQPTQLPDPTTPPKKPPIRSQFVARVPVTTTASNLVPSKPGYVWAGDHWERAKTTSAVIRDHRHDDAVVPHDPNGFSSISTFGPLASTPPPAVGRPATQSSAGGASGGVTVTIRQNSRNDVIGGW